jgi:hypothetical protein
MYLSTSRPWSSNLKTFRRSVGHQILKSGRRCAKTGQRDQLKSAPALRPWRLKVDQVYLLSLAMDLIPKVPLDKLRPSQVSDFYRSQLLRLSPGSVRRLHALLRRSLGVAVRWALIP